MNRLIEALLPAALSLILFFAIVALGRAAFETLLAGLTARIEMSIPIPQVKTPQVR